MSWRSALLAPCPLLAAAFAQSQEPSLQLVSTGVITQATSVVLQGVVMPGYL